MHIVDIAETVNSIAAIGFSDVKRIDIEETNVVLSGPDGESDSCDRLEEGDGSDTVDPQLVVPQLIVTIRSIDAKWDV